VSPDRTELLS
jgi:DNA repair exonuclease SbcCD ATPase subunit